MPYKKTIRKAQRAKRSGKSASAQAGEFVREQIEKIRKGRSGARSAKQAIAIGLSQARRAGVDLKPPKRGEVSERVRRRAEKAYEQGQNPKHAEKPSATRSKAIQTALKREGSQSVSRAALSRHAKAAAKHRTAAERSASAKKAAKTKGRKKRVTAAKKRGRSHKKSSRKT